MTGFNPAYNVAAPDASENVLPPINAEKRQRKKNKSGAFGIFRAALYMLRKRTDEKEAATMKAAEKEKSNGGGDWKKIVQSMRPLHMQEMPASPVRAAWPASDVFGAASPAPSCSSSTGTMSQYASATNLRDLCNEDEIDEEERDPDEVFDAIEGDEMIDAKAEEFIAQFYRSIHHQNSIHRQDRGV